MYSLIEPQTDDKKGLPKPSLFDVAFGLQNLGDTIIVNVGSIYGLVAGDMSLYNKNDRKTSEIYGASKAAVIHLTKYLANYMGKFNVRVNCISPGGVLNKKLQKKNFIKKYSKKPSLGRMANSKEILNTLIFLLNEDSDYITGQNLIVDGGYTLTWMF